MRKNLTDAQRWANYAFLPSFVLGFHGCDAAVGEAILNGDIAHLKVSSNDYDWLGEGIYFWEGSPARALKFAEERAQGSLNSKRDIKKPFVLGAVINLRHCLDLADRAAIALVQQAFPSAVEWVTSRNEPLPHNGKGLKTRRLDCLVFNTLHRIRDENENLEPFDSVRGLFWEGEEIYPGAGVREENDVQICVRNTDCILGYFRPIPLR